MTARQAILDAIPAAADSSGTFTIMGVLKELDRRGSTYEESTIRTHIASSMCIDAPENHGTTYPDLERVGRGLYRLRARS